LTADSDDDLWAIAHDQPPYARLLGLRVITATRDRIEAELTVTLELGNRNGVMHGGAIMGFADNLGGTATFLNLPEGMATSTIESKTNFFATIRIGETARGICTPLHRGRSTMTWQTEILREDGRRAALVTQTQILLPRR
jgi:1,4-dihydroxy-2-naphthoyl-CoA hydrolase